MIRLVFKMDRFFGNRLRPAVWKKVQESSGVLIVGCEGGFNVLNALPIYFAVEEMQKPVVLCNMSLASLKNSLVPIVLRDPGISQSPVLYRVSSTSEFTQSGTKAKEYFPEKYLCEWFSSQNQLVHIYCTERTGPKNLSLSYSKICEEHNLNLIILVDHGNDSLLAGNEKEIGTYLEDILTITAAKRTKIDSILCNMVIGYDRHSGVSDCSTFRAIAEITEAGGALGNFSLSKKMPEVQKYLQACEYVEEKMPWKNGQGLFLRNALEGNFGNLDLYHLPHKTFINPIMTQVFFHDLEAVVRRIKFWDFVEDTNTASDVVSGIEYYRTELQEPVEEEIPRTKEF